jgi:peptidyl-prolyl cis-trans isomerase A (cyclophilin A)
MRLVSFAAAFVGLVALASQARANPIVRFSTSLGTFDVELCAESSVACPGAAPDTVANFLHYVDAGAYPDTSFVHRRGFGGPSPLVFQGGGYWIDGGIAASVPPFPAIPLELDPNLSNLRGTLAMARASALDSATSQWFVNLVDNVALDTAGGGYAVFGQVVRGLEVVDAIGALQIWNLGVVFSELPLLDTYPGSGAVTPYLVYVSDISRIPEPGTMAMLLLGLAGLARTRRAIA